MDSTDRRRPWRRTRISWCRVTPSWTSRPPRAPTPTTSPTPGISRAPSPASSPGGTSPSSRSSTGIGRAASRRRFPHLRAVRHRPRNYGTFTDYDMPPKNMEPGARPKLPCAEGHLDLRYDSGAGTTTWTACRDESRRAGALHLRLRRFRPRHGGAAMELRLHLTPTRPPVPVGASVYNGKIVACLQDGTYSYFQTGTHMTGTLRWGAIDEARRRRFRPHRPAVVPALCRRRGHRWRPPRPGARVAHHQPGQRRGPSCGGSSTAGSATRWCPLPVSRRPTPTAPHPSASRTSKW